MVEGNSIEADSAQRFIIERPRLTRLLNETNARIILLLAPAGYGKTTLARQWLSARDAAWYRGARGSSDIASVAVAVAQAAGVVCAGAETRLLAQVRATPSPEDVVDRLAETLATDLASWPQNAWLSIDDYLLVAGFAAADRFLELLVELSPIRLLLTARERPHWLSSRQALYGEVFELRAPELALTDGEARRVLSHVPTKDANRIIAAAQGWPAVTRLAAIRGSLDIKATGLPAELYGYFAEELYAAAPDDVRHGLLTLATMPSLTPRLAQALLGERYDAVRETAVALGFLTQGAANTLELHPLLRTFLQTKLRETRGARRIIRRAANAAISASRWQEAFTLIEQFELDEILPTLFEAGLDHLLRENYLTTLQAWIDYATARRCDFPLLDLADAEVCRRRGNGQGAEAHALQAARRFETSDRHRASRAYEIAGAAAQRDMRLCEARAHYQRAASLATDRVQARRACWGEFVVATQLEDPDAADILAHFERLSEKTPSDVLRAAAGGLMLVMRDGSIDAAVEYYSRLLPLVERADDAFVTTQFVYRLGYMHIIAGRYAEGERLAAQAAADAEAAGLAFVQPPAAAARAAAAIGLRRLKRAALQVENVAGDAHRVCDRYEIANARALRVRIALQQRDLGTPATELQGWRTLGDPALRYESAGLLALAHALSEEHDAAFDLAAEVIRSTRYTQALTLAHIARAVTALDRSSAADDELAELEAILDARRDWDSLVLGYRCCPDLLRRIYERGQIDLLRLEEVVRAAHDLRIASAAGWHLARPSRKNHPLTRREREVLDLVAQGLTNKEIAAKLVIEEVTVKVHVRHILEKVGARSRTQAVAMLNEDA